MIECNGVFRYLESQLVNVNGVWRNVDSEVNVNGVYRKAGYRLTHIDADMIDYFVLIYSLHEFPKSYSTYENTQFNSNMANLVKTDITSSDNSLDRKSFIFQYDNVPPDVYGSYCYKGTLYAHTNQKIMVAVSQILKQKEIDKPLDIKVNMETTHVHKGRKFTGWNQLFSVDSLLTYDDNDYHSGDLTINILPVSSRSLNYADSLYAGICRFPDVDINMNGGEGYIDHTFNSIMVNDTPYPFMIKIK